MLVRLVALVYYRTATRRRIASRQVPTMLSICRGDVTQLHVSGQKFDVARKSSGPHILNKSNDMDVLFLCEGYIINYIRKQHVVQLAQNMDIPSCPFCVYAIKREVASLKTMLVYSCN